MGALQPGVTFPAMIPQDWHVIVIDLKDCFFTIPLAAQDREKFAFTLLSTVNSLMLGFNEKFSPKACLIAPQCANIMFIKSYNCFEKDGPLLNKSITWMTFYCSPIPKYYFSDFSGFTVRSNLPWDVYCL